MIEHTPGPWKAIYVGCNDWDLIGPVTEQDWKLAAAAPELLKALMRLMRSFPTDTDLLEAQWDGHEIEEAMSAHDAARAAIDKVKGENT